MSYLLCICLRDVKRSVQHPLDVSEYLLPNLDQAEGHEGLNWKASEDMILCSAHSLVFLHIYLFPLSGVRTGVASKLQILICER